MNTHHTKAKGDLGVLKAQLDLYEKGFWVSSPLTENAPFDLIATKGGKSYTTQVKYRSMKKNGTLEVSFRTSWADKNGTHIKSVDMEQIDWYIIYCPETDKCYYLDPKKFDRINGIHLRLVPPKNNQRSNILMVDDYMEPPI
jgi:hypothetical protein